jgi:hypothetical protein
MAIKTWQAPGRLRSNAADYLLIGEWFGMPGKLCKACTFTRILK